MVGLDVGDDRDGRRVGEERAVALVGLGDEDVAEAVVRARPRRQQVAADHERRVGAAGLQRDDEHRRGRRLARAARHAGGAVVGHELGEHRGAVEHRDAARGGLEQLGVVRVGLVHGLGRDEAGGPAGQEVEVVRVVADRDLGAERPERQHRARVLGVGPRHHRPARQQDARDPAHRRAAGPDEVHPRQQAGQGRHGRVGRGVGRGSAPGWCCSTWSVGLMSGSSRSRSRPQPRAPWRPVSRPPPRAPNAGPPPRWRRADRGRRRGR